MMQLLAHVDGCKVQLWEFSARAALEVFCAGEELLLPASVVSNSKQPTYSTRHPVTLDDHPHCHLFAHRESPAVPPFTIITSLLLLLAFWVWFLVWFM